MLSCSAAPGAIPRTRLVVIDGNDAITAALARLLADRGLRLEVGGSAADAADLAVRTGEPEAVPDLVVLVGPGLTSPTRWGPWRARGVPHLPVEYDEDVVIIGPVVAPGTACLGCLDLHRWDRLRHGVRRGDPPRRTPRHAGPRDVAAPRPDPIVATLGSGIAAMVARDLVLHRRHLPQVSLEVTSGAPEIAARRWERHPRCDCHLVGATMVL